MEGSRRRALLKSAKVKAVAIPLLIAGPVAVFVSGEAWVAGVVFAFYVLLAIAFDSRIVFYTLLGLAAGHLLDPAVKGGTGVWRVLETAEHWFVGMAFGTAIGFVLEAVRRASADRPTTGTSEAGGGGGVTRSRQTDDRITC